MTASALVTFAVPGFHRWAEAPDHRDYLRSRHRHLFHVRVELELFHDDREVEFHDLRDFAIELFGGGELGTASCEMIARELLQEITRRFGQDRRALVEVWEDGECGARVTWP